MNGTSPPPVYDVLLVGGGLQSALVALAMLHLRPEARVAVIERDRRLCGNHTWSFHAGDVPDDAIPFVEPLVSYAWPGYDVHFPGLARSVAARYAAISSDHLADALKGRLEGSPGCGLFLGSEATAFDATSVTLAGGRMLRGHLVVDARGPDALARPRSGGFQKFLGLELVLAEAHRCTRPLLMDARVEQRDGYRFFYVLPLAERRLLVEDTYFSDRPELDAPALRERVLRYAADRGFVATDIVREERGVLPLPARGLPVPAAASPLMGGYGGGWFHPATGYSFPVALRLAMHIARAKRGEVFGDDWQGLVARQRSQFRFAALLNRLLFQAYAPADRWNALERFYRQPSETIHRFYALDMTRADRLRLLCGRPPRGISWRGALGGWASI